MVAFLQRVSIFKYTGIDYNNMNGLLRGTIVPEDYGKTLMDIAVASVALNALPSIELPNVTRMEHRDRLDTMLENAKQQRVVQSSGFTSAAFKAVGHILVMYRLFFKT